MKAAENSQLKYISLRIFLVGLVFIVLFGAIGAKAMFVQVFRGSWLSQKAADQYEASFQLYGKRGTIYDRNHREMAVSIEATSIAAHPHLIENHRAAAKALAAKLKLNERALYRQLASDKTFIWIKRQASPKETEAVRALNLSGIIFKPEQNRFYPNRTLAAQVLGFSGIDGNGLEGVEYFYDDYLKQTHENLTVLRDALGREIVAEKDIAPDQSGKSLILTIDRNIQYIAESTLAETVKEFEAVSGVVIVTAPKTGAILALAHVPFFNANAFQDFSQQQWRNRAITDPFEPGSTMKIFSAAAAIERGNSTPNSIYYCENGEYRIGSNIIHDTHPYGWLSLQQIVKYSSNIGIAKVGELIGTEALFNTLRDFGFGEKTGIDCPGETPGSLTSHKNWSKLDAGSIAFGQGISVSAIQLITAVGAIANDGVLMKPYIVQAITDNNGRLIRSTQPQVVRRAISPQTARAVKKILQTVIQEGGTGTNAAIEGFSVGGKTGTAQKTDENGTYAKGKYIASFVGFTPVEDPALAILVVVNEPRKNNYGGIVAAPAFKKIALEALSYLNISPDKGRNNLTVSLQGEAAG
ncbi:MAG: penicillin-binding protein 2 [Thermodesulfobacteriota bacterium]